jgi:hypothetical protein
MIFDRIHTLITRGRWRLSAPARSIRPGATGRWPGADLRRPGRLASVLMHLPSEATPSGVRSWNPAPRPVPPQHTSATRPVEFASSTDFASSTLPVIAPHRQRTHGEDERDLHLVPQIDADLARDIGKPSPITGDARLLILAAFSHDASSGFRDAPPQPSPQSLLRERHHAKFLPAPPLTARRRKEAASRISSACPKRCEVKSFARPADRGRPVKQSNKEGCS